MKISRIIIVISFLIIATCTGIFWEFPEQASGTEVSGEVSGTWNSGMSPFYLVDNITIPYGQSLTIWYGVEIIANGSYHILVGGYLIVIGLSANPVEFRGNASNPNTFKWDGIIFNETGYGSIQNCTIREATIGFRLNSSESVKLDNCDIRDNYIGVLCDNNSKDNSFYNCDLSYNTFGCRFNNSSDNRIIETEIRYNDLDGLVFWNSTQSIIQSCSIYQNGLGIRMLENSIDNYINSTYIGENSGINDENIGLEFTSGSRFNLVNDTNFDLNKLVINNINDSNIIISDCWFNDDLELNHTQDTKISRCNFYWGYSSILLDSVEDITINTTSINTYNSGILIHGDSRNVFIDNIYYSLIPNNISLFTGSFKVSHNLTL
ncbi:right-handed parallel beta-helix repeat-containing protein [[Eubacterium] cellulosolvens]